jgi:hypothetical protein
MDVLEAHARLARVQDDRGGPEPGTETFPLLATALASLSGRLADAEDHEGLHGAVQAGRELFEAGVVTEADVHAAANRVLVELDQFVAEQEGPPCLALTPSAN